jgi:hypothetical protein
MAYFVYNEIRVYLEQDKELFWIELASQQTTIESDKHLNSKP